MDMEIFLAGNKLHDDCMKIFSQAGSAVHVNIGVQILWLLGAAEKPYSLIASSFQRVRVAETSVATVSGKGARLIRGPQGRTKHSGCLLPARGFYLNLLSKNIFTLRLSVALSDYAHFCQGLGDSISLEKLILAGSLWLYGIRGSCCLCIGLRDQDWSRLLQTSCTWCARFRQFAFCAAIRSKRKFMIVVQSKSVQSGI